MKKTIQETIQSKTADTVICPVITIHFRPDEASQDIKLEKVRIEAMLGAFDPATGIFEAIQENEMKFRVPAVNGGKPYFGRRITIQADNVPGPIRSQLENQLHDLAALAWINKNSLNEG